MEIDTQIDKCTQTYTSTVYLYNRLVQACHFKGVARPLGGGERKAKRERMERVNSKHERKREREGPQD